MARRIEERRNVGSACELLCECVFNCLTLTQSKRHHAERAIWKATEMFDCEAGNKARLSPVGTTAAAVVDTVWHMDKANALAFGGGCGGRECKEPGVGKKKILKNYQALIPLSVKSP